MRLNFRLLCLLGFVACYGALAFAIVYLQNTLGYEPCPFCIFQRVAMAVVGAIFLIAAIHGPRDWGRRVYAGLAALASLVGIGIAWRHVWLQSLPPDQVPACGPTLDYLMEMMPVNEVVMTVLRGDGNCAKIDAQWLGIALPGWVLISFIGLTLYSLLLPVLARTLERR
ncbi:disulfide bond formation protein B [Solimonas flava]|uniref:disulfide bond formation protein B n=1 Tax=Solimonas flava TaxID=415849 RepID=UPI00040C2BD8|nr:disulfide bond formation protein B [Solimonas flava]